MQVKVFESTDMTSGLKLVKKELGPEALIISTRTVRNGKLGLLGKPTLEITAAIDTAIPTPRSLSDPIPETFRLERRKQKSGFSRVVDQSLDHLLDQPAEDLSAVSADFSSRPSTVITEGSTSLADEVTELKNLVKGLSGEIAQLYRDEDNLNSSSLSPSGSMKNEASLLHSGSPVLQAEKIRTMLISVMGINSDSARQITALLQADLGVDELNDSRIVAQKITQIIERYIHISPPSFGSSDEQQRFAFVGPTGVGKTTTLAKIAASYLADHSPSIALITIDTYRIAAVEQLKVYGEIMRIPVDVVITPDQLKLVIEKHQDKDLILIDTAGRSPRDGFSIDELATFLSPELNIDKHLVLSAATREAELLNTIERFDSLGIKDTIFTKIDECSNLGVLLNIQVKKSVPLSYVTNGQRVPEDLVKVSQSTVAELIMSQNEGLMHD